MSGGRCDNPSDALDNGAFRLWSAIRVCDRSGCCTRVEASSSPPRLTRDVPRFVTHWCDSARSRPPLPVVCPPLVHHEVPTVSWIERSFAGQHEHPAFKAAVRPDLPDCVQRRRQRPDYWHWIAGIGAPEAIQYWVLSGARNEVKGKPHRTARSRSAPAGSRSGSSPIIPQAASSAGTSLRSLAPVHTSQSRASTATTQTRTPESPWRLARKADAAR